MGTRVPMSDEFFTEQWCFVWAAKNAIPKWFQHTIDSLRQRSAVRRIWNFPGWPSAFVNSSVAMVVVSTIPKRGEFGGKWKIKWAKCLSVCGSWRKSTKLKENALQNVFIIWSARHRLSCLPTLLLMSLKLVGGLCRNVFWRKYYAVTPFTLTNMSCIWEVITVYSNELSQRTLG